MTILYAEYIDLKELNGRNKNKREYENVKLCQRMVRIAKHYLCCAIVSEKLNVVGKNYGIKGVNVKNNNQWNHNFRFKKLKMLCCVNGIEFLEVDPAYSSFIGNMIYDYYDPVNASIEIGRRGYFVLLESQKEKFYPETQLVKHRWKETLNNTKGGWVKFFKQMRDVKYRVLLEDSIFEVFRFSSIRSCIKLYNFI
jgi:IS605 OrfB family transposase